MDENLFQVVTVALLGVTLLVLLVTLLTLNKVSKRLEDGAGAPADSQALRDEHRHDEPAPSQTAPAQSSAPEPVAQTSAFPAAQAAQPEPGAQQVQPEEAKEPARAEEPQPVAVAEAPVQEPQQAQAATGFEDAPEEQPFERDGRWWFKRGDELLVYDEQSGQWEPAPTAPAAPSPAPPAAPQAGSWQQSGASPAVSGQSEQAAQPAEEPGSFWKCPSCGAVNGSTATSCRMCFTPKP